jgi:hypothetical protein
MVVMSIPALGFFGFRAVRFVYISYRQRRQIHTTYHSLKVYPYYVVMLIDRSVTRDDLYVTDI